MTTQTTRNRLVPERFIDVPAQLHGVGDAEVALRGVQVLMAEPRLNCSHRNMRGLPPTGARLPQAVKEHVLAHCIGFARHFNRALAVVPPLVHGRAAFSAVNSRIESDALELLEEVALGFAVLVHEEPA